MAWFKWAQEGSTQIGVTLDVLKLQKEKASNKSLDLPKAFISSVFTFFPGVDCIKMRFYTYFVAQNQKSRYNNLVLA